MIVFDPSWVEFSGSRLFLQSRLSSVPTDSTLAGLTVCTLKNCNCYESYVIFFPLCKIALTVTLFFGVGYVSYRYIPGGVSMPNCTPPVCVALVFRVMHDLFVNRAYLVRRLGLFFVVGAPAPTPYWGGGAWGYCRRGGWSIRTKLSYF